MTRDWFMPYVMSCIWLAVPILAFNLIFAGDLPAAYQAGTFWDDIPAPLAFIENLGRFAVLLLPVLMPLRLEPDEQAGWWVYGVGLVVYGLAWLALIAAPGGAWAQSLPGFAAPAYTPALWLAGIALIGARQRPGLLWVYAGDAVVFLAAHNAHTYIVYDRLH